MGRVWAGALLVTVSGALGAMLGAAVLFRWRRRRGVPAGLAWRRCLAEAGLVAGTLPWLWLTLTPRPHPRMVHLVPLSDLVDQVRTMPAGWVAEQAVGNLLVFAALGFFTPIRYAGMARPGRVVLLGAVASAVVEFLQYVLDIGRVSSVDDILLNALGAGLAGLLSRGWWASRPSPGPRPGPDAAAGSETVPGPHAAPGLETVPGPHAAAGLETVPGPDAAAGCPAAVAPRAREQPRSARESRGG